MGEGNIFTLCVSPHVGAVPPSANRGYPHQVLMGGPPPHQVLTGGPPILPNGGGVLHPVLTGGGTWGI